MRLCTLLFVLPIFACGGGSTPAEAPPSTGGETPPVQEVAETDEPFEDEVEEAPLPTGPGQVHAVIRVGNEEREGTLSIQTSQGDVVAEGQAGDTLTLPAGSYRVIGTLEAPEGQGSLYGSRTEEIQLITGETLEVALRYEVARIRINVRRNGRAVGRWRMTLTREGSEGEITLTPSREHVTVPPGRYSGVLHVGARRIEVAGLLFQGGATMDVPVNVE